MEEKGWEGTGEDEVQRRWRGTEAIAEGEVEKKRKRHRGLHREQCREG